MNRLFPKLLSNFKKSHKQRSRRDRKVRPAVEPLEERRLMATLVTSPNTQNPIIPNVQVETVYYSSAWSGQASNSAQAAELAAEAQDLNQFFDAITGGHYLDALSQYYMTTPHGTIIRPGDGQFVKADFVPAQLTTGQTVSESAIQTMLSNEIQAGKLDAPNGNTLYMVFMPPGVAEGGDLKSGGGHHSSFAYGAGNAYFATIEYPTTTDPATGRLFRPGGNVGTETNFQFMTEVASHELVEAISDPLVNVPSEAAWYDRNTGNEIGDITQKNPPAGGVMALEGASGYGYVVQKYWSNQDNNSIIPAPGGSNLQAIKVVPDLANFEFGLTDQNGRILLGNWGNLISSNVDGSQVSFSGTFAGQAVTVNVQANDGQKLDVQIVASSGNTLFNGIISQPSGSWQNLTATGEGQAPAYAELSGTVYEAGRALTAFGTGGAQPQQQFTGAQYGSSYGGSGCGPGDGPNGQFNNYNSPNPRHWHNYE
jgi:hypothetical protein